MSLASRTTWLSRVFSLLVLVLAPAVAPPRAVGQSPAEPVNWDRELMWLMDAGEFVRAERLLRGVLATQEKGWGRPDHPGPMLALTLHNLAGFYLVRADYRQAEALFRRALGIRERALGRYSLEVAQTLEGVAAALRAMHWDPRRHRSRPGPGKSGPGAGLGWARPDARRGGAAERRIASRLFRELAARWTS